jgi:SAM-dependent methyltransferase
VALPVQQVRKQDSWRPAPPRIIIIRGAMSTLYDRIGRTYAASRAADPRLAAAIRAAIGDARSVVNVGAGSGAYEPRDLDVIAIEPSPTMTAQRAPGDPARILQATAEHIPLPDDSADVALAVLSDHHWPDRVAGLRELARVARRRIVLVNSDPGAARDFWLTRDYLPEFLTLIPAPYRATTGHWRDELRDLLGGKSTTFHPLPIPHDCTDGFYQAFWRRPHAYLEAEIRDNISVFRRLPPDRVAVATRRLAADLASGAWHARNPALRHRATHDAGLRIVVADL